MTPFVSLILKFKMTKTISFDEKRSYSCLINADTWWLHWPPLKLLRGRLPHTSTALVLKAPKAEVGSQLMMSARSQWCLSQHWTDESLSDDMVAREGLMPVFWSFSREFFNLQSFSMNHTRGTRKSFWADCFGFLCSELGDMWGSVLIILRKDFIYLYWCTFLLR